MTPISFLVPFTCIFPMPTQYGKKNSDINTLPLFFLQIAKNSSKSARSQKFLPPHESPKPPPNRHQTATNPPNRHFYQHCCTHLWILQTALLCIKWRKYGYDGIFNQFETNVSIKRTFYRYLDWDRLRNALYPESYFPPSIWKKEIKCIASLLQ